MFTAYKKFMATTVSGKNVYGTKVHDTNVLWHLCFMAGTV